MTQLTRIVAHISTADSGEIHSLVLDAATGGLLGHHRFLAGPRVMPVVLHPDGDTLFAAIRCEPFRLASLAVDNETGALSLIAEYPLPFSMTAISVDRSGRWLLGTSYADGAVTVSPVDEGAVRCAPVQIIESGKYSHAVKVDVSNATVYAPCLGADKIAQFHFDPGSGLLTPMTAAEAPKGHGPRHLIFTPDNRFAFVLHEMTGAIMRYEREPSGALHPLGLVSTLPEGTKLVPGVARPALGAQDEVSVPENPAYAADIDITPDGRFVFTTERTDSTLSVLACRDGDLRLIAAQATERHPCVIKVDPTGRLLIATGAESAWVTVHLIDRDSGALTPVTRVEIGTGASGVAISHLQS